MRLLNAETFGVENFDDPEKVEYAILSHRWVDGKELNFEALQDLAILDKLRLAKPETVSKPQSLFKAGYVPEAWKKPVTTRLASIHDFQLFVGS